MCNGIYNAGYKAGSSEERKEDTEYLNAIAKEAYESGYGEGWNEHASAMQQSLTDASSVVKVVFNGCQTIVCFADGEHVVVTYDPNCGYEYDAEKAVMSAMLKRLVGNEYIHVLKHFVYDRNAIVVNSKGCYNDVFLQSMKRNVSDNMISKFDNHVNDTNDLVERCDDGLVVNISEDEWLYSELNSMNDDIMVVE